MSAIKIVDRNEGIFRVGKQVYYVEMTNMLYPNSFMKNVINSMSDVFVYEDQGDNGKHHYAKPEEDDVFDTDIVEFIMQHEENWKPLQDE